MKSRLKLSSGITCVLSSALILVASPASHAKEELPVLATTKADAGSDYKGATIEVRSAKRSKAGSFTTVSWTVKNDSKTDFKVVDMDNDVYSYGGNEVSGVTLVDEQAGIRYNPLQDSERHCLCAGSFGSGEFLAYIAPDNQGTYWSSYLVPKDVKKVSLKVPGFNQTKEITIE